MAWTKLGDEFADEAWQLPDAAWRTHVEALLWSGRLGLDLVIPKRHLRRFAFTADPEAAAAELCAAGWWKDDGDFWDVSLRFADWQVERAVVEQRREGAALRKRRQRRHEAGDHGLCLPGNCPHVTRDGTRDPGRDGTGRGSQSEVLSVDGSVSQTDKIKNATETVARRYGWTPSHARRVAAEVLSRANGDVDNPAAYVVRAVERERQRYEPAADLSTPPLPKADPDDVDAYLAELRARRAAP
jgi:hypothetical protein